MYDFYEFFAGGGMARAGLGEEWRCIFANDFDHKKSRIYQQNWGGVELKTADVSCLTPADLPARANLSWASFPCQDLSLAGEGAGLKGERSGTFWPFWNLMKALVTENRAPDLIVLENVCGAITSHDGEDFAAICAAFRDAGYQFGAIVVDAALFVPQSRPRLFIIGIRRDLDLPKHLTAADPSSPWHTKVLRNAHKKLPRASKREWIWWNLPLPSPRRLNLSDIIEEASTGAEWFSAEETRRLLGMMSAVHLGKVKKAKQLGHRVVGAVYRRMRRDEYGQKVQRAEVRFDDVAGCLRTPAGGSSRQLTLFVEGEAVRARRISSRETARLMGLPDDYQLPVNYNEAYHLTGDGVVVPVVRHLAQHIFEPILKFAQPRNAAVQSTGFSRVG